ncbi:MAG: tetraacyldisaccharide 4'-kinase [Nitrosomonas sp.]|nr:tetraacyldisaccharide 4'-kinase [Nitrosomonas sp.]MDP1950035.1 tetraacyldisaccharide 4'-kinase [Nitrosomonas sp.]
MKLSELYWHRITPLHFLLWPLSLLFRLLISLRRLCYWLDLFPSVSLPVPVIVVDSITVEDTGKIPFIFCLIEFLQSRGMNPGLISCGYSDNSSTPVAVTAFSDPAIVGGKSLWLAQRCGNQCPVWIGDDRVAAAQALLAANPDCNILINDDGLQYHRLQRDIEIVVIDYNEQNFGNGLILPAGPLRESFNRLQDVDAIVVHGEISEEIDTRQWARIFNMKLVKDSFYNALNPTNRTMPTAFSGKHLHAMAQLDNAPWFFDQIDRLGLTAECHTFANNHPYVKNDFQFPDADAVLMAEKEAIGCQSFADKTLWILPIEAYIEDEFREVMLKKINESLIISARNTC